MTTEHQERDEPLRLHESTFRINWRTALGEGEDYGQAFGKWGYTSFIAGWIWLLAGFPVSGAESDIMTMPDAVYLLLVAIEHIAGGVMLLAATLETASRPGTLGRYVLLVILSMLAVGYLFQTRCAGVSPTENFGRSLPSASFGGTLEVPGPCIPRSKPRVLGESEAWF